MSIIDSLVYDRTQADVDRVFALKNKILEGGLTALSPEEKAEYLAGMKGAYNYTDLNRIGEAVQYISNRAIQVHEELDTYREEQGVAYDPLCAMPYEISDVSTSPKINWTMADVPTQSQAHTFISNLNILRGLMILPSNAPAVPDSLDRMTYQSANDIERLLAVIDSTLTQVRSQIYHNIDMAVMSFRYANTYYCGDE